MRYDRTGLEVLDEAECLRLLGSVPVGRIAFTHDALPAVQPVTFVLNGGSVVFRTREGSKLAAATRNAVVAFEVDEFDAATRTGWNVTVVGRARVVTDPDELAELAALDLRPWAPGQRDRYVQISVDLVQGRRIVRRPRD
ncbi:Pyridoxamine 5'-phosphate oxidase [Streptoalloteichus tenebrarius]|uniref:Pyridoxamine 5'-phosphate oxidase n=1 Tax=Streptoalloteichus tenebrarius (strain ATCC 17920 / DSM 40477 / JCM 4838 / CBS 697.72 / NBRC 16177 / NCIMB 11028 / NRRL B-12390 / A12253. 1 / ISP 5477) TaxID=1933 RepID=A0ABT1HUA4_STRSD|nr:pyridoxamine 5'-phosphate oxidase family protein [Streptoalloteichus tenebrarius]MCP2259108.1 Pyridoxamine 5'-phosphate oxidase [Streptoalloteichus tenebrarius]BFE99566.1 pyridoxamine 5'-phosphate oxidase family protein [Streptoalloteichus tenebrarius]